MNRYFFNNILAGVAIKDAIDTQCGCDCSNLDDGETKEKLHKDAECGCEKITDAAVGNNIAKEVITDINIKKTQNEEKKLTDDNVKQSTAANEPVKKPSASVIMKKTGNGEKNPPKEKECPAVFKIESPTPRIADAKKLLEQMSVIAANKIPDETELIDYLDICIRHNRLVEYIHKTSEKT